MANYRLRLVRVNSLKLRVSTRIPASLVGQEFITITRGTDGKYNINVDYSILNPGPIVDPTTANIAVWDMTAGQYKSVSLASLLTSGLDPDVQAIAALTGTGILSRTADGTWALRTLQAPVAGITITNPGGVAGNETFALANDLAALEGLAGTGLARRTGTDTWTVGTTVSVGEGGTGLTAGTSGGIPYFSSTSTMGSTGLLPLNAPLIGGGAGAGPSYGSNGVNGQLYLGNTSAAPAFTTMSGDATIANTGALTISGNAVTDAKFRQSVGLSVVGRSANTTGNTADITGTAGQVLRVSGTALGFGAVDLSLAAAVTNQLSSTNGGTGVNNGGRTFTYGGNVTFSGAFASTFTFSATTSVTFPTTGTLATLAGAETLTNKTLTAPNINGAGIAGAINLGIRSTGTGAFDLNFANTENLTAARTLTFQVNDANRTISLGGNVGLSGGITAGGSIAFSGAFGTTFTVTGTTSVTLPTTGTLATQAGSETLTNKTFNSTANTLQLSGSTITTASSILDILGSTRGQLLYRGAAGWTVLSPGTAGQFLTTQGAGADPSWSAGGAGTGTVTSVGFSAGAGISISGTNPITSSGSVTIARAQGGFSAHLNGTSQTGIASGVDTKIIFGTTIFNDSSYYNTSNGRWTPPAGRVTIAAQLYITGTFPGTLPCVCAIWKNGAVFKEGFIYSGSSNNGIALVNIVDSANGTDYYECYARQQVNSGTATVDGTPKWSFFSGSIL